MHEMFQLRRTTQQGERSGQKYKEGGSRNRGCEDIIPQENKQKLQHCDHGFVGSLLHFPSHYKYPVWL